MSLCYERSGGTDAIGREATRRASDGKMHTVEFDSISRDVIVLTRRRGRRQVWGTELGIN